MLINLHVKNLALIEEADIDFTDHLNILTGETGAGKSVLIGSIQSALGGIITSEDIAKKVPKNTADVYVRVDENKLYYVLEDGETGDVDIWD